MKRTNEKRARVTPRGRIATPIALCALLLALPATLPAQAITEGPARGTLIIAGGGRLGPEIMSRFVELAGGRQARIVVIPTAGESNDYGDDYMVAQQMRRLGAAKATVLHTRDPKVANREEFVAPLLDATAVWIPGGRQWRLADTYLGTRTLEELFALLDRGGVIGGSSAGASIQASYMVRGAPEGNTIMMAPGHELGFALLENAAVDQHLLVRGREQDMLAVISAHPDLLGIGLDEGTAIEVRADSAIVIGVSLAAFYNAADAGSKPYYFLEAGDVFDLRRRMVRRGVRQPPETADARAAMRVVERLFDTIIDADSVSARRLFHPGAHITTISDSEDGASTVEVTGLDDFLAQLGARATLRQSVHDPEVRIDGDLVSVWAHYEALVDGQPQRCGTDSFQLARSDSQWRIVDVTYTVRSDGCEGR